MSNIKKVISVNAPLVSLMEKIGKKKFRLMSEDALTKNMVNIIYAHGNKIRYMILENSCVVSISSDTEVFGRAERPTKKEALNDAISNALYLDKMERALQTGTPKMIEPREKIFMGGEEFDYCVN